VNAQRGDDVEVAALQQLGAGEVPVMLQFVVEALVVSWLGGTIGLFLGAGFAAAMSITGALHLFLAPP